MIKTLAALALATLTLVTTSCGGSDSAASPNERVPAQVSLPSTLLGLNVAPEDLGQQIEQVDQPYIDSVGLFAMREPSDDLLRATLQVSRFTDEARPESGEFRGSIISRIGGTAPNEVRVGGRTIYITTGQNQTVFIWFEANGFFVLSVHSDFAFPRTMLRRVLEQGVDL